MGLDNCCVLKLVYLCTEIAFVAVCLFMGNRLVAV